MGAFIGRESELQFLRGLFKKKNASLIVIRGRRRIGKSRLVEEFGKEYRLCRFSGIPPVSATTAQSQRDEFSNQLGNIIGVSGIKSDDWNTLFLLLSKETQKGKTILLFDEISWMGSKDPEFLGKLKNAWDIHFKQNDKLILILCGSASFWIEENILNNTGFVGRISYTLTLDELPLRDCKLFWGNQSKHMSAYEKFQIFSVVGGVPKYLEEIDPTISAEHNIRRLCFTKGGLLVDEFEHIFSDLFSNRSNTYKKIVEFLASGSKEITDISVKLNMPQTGRLSQYLKDLELSGFIKRDYTWILSTGEDSKLSKYRLCDNYLRFFLKYIAKYKTKIARDGFKFKSLVNLPAWFSILGLQFENLVLNNRSYIHQCLNLREEEIISSNPFFQRKTKESQGCQIDYMIHTKHNNLYLCEIKFSKSSIDTGVIADMEQKINKIKRPKGFSCIPVLIHVNGVTAALEKEDYFAHIIDFSELLSC
ncbi:MAG: AAA family ATPase [Rickettsiales bacterium]|nr:AAA family ATPase [Rickettsiales bacterium]